MAAKRTSRPDPAMPPAAARRASTVDAGGGATIGIAVTATARDHEGPTGVEMEALTAVTVALLTIYDMVKAVDRGMAIGGVRLLAKSGGSIGRLAGAMRPPA